MTILRFFAYYVERLGDWAACRRYERMLFEFQVDTRVKGSRLPVEFRARRAELRKKRLHLELGRSLDLASRDTD